MKDFLIAFVLIVGSLTALAYLRGIIRREYEEVERQIPDIKVRFTGII